MQGEAKNVIASGNGGMRRTLGTANEWATCLRKFRAYSLTRLGAEPAVPSDGQKRAAPERADVGRTEQSIKLEDD